MADDGAQHESRGRRGEEKIETLSSSQCLSI